MKRLVIFALCSLSTLLFSVETNRLPGYRATYFMHTIDADQLYIGPAKTRKGSCSFGDTKLATVFGPIESKNYSANLIAGVRNMYVHLSDKIKPSNTQYAILGAAGLYKGSNRWLWTANFTVQPELTQPSLKRHTRYVGLVEGIFSWTEQTSAHVGAYTELGMRTTKLKPLLGLSHTTENWKYQAVYPIKAGITYKGFTKGLLSLMARPFSATVKTDKALSHRPATVRYRATGIELRYDYLITTKCDIYLGVGSTLSSKLFIGDARNNHRHSLRIEKTPYAFLGVTAAIR